MLSSFSLCAFLAPALVSALPWDGAVETAGVGAEGVLWSPAPTAAPAIFELFRRQNANAPGPNTCGYVSGIETSSLTCLNNRQICATISSLGVHGCCDPDGLDNCYIATTCIANSALSACTGDCQSDLFATKCTNSLNGACYEWRYDFGSTVVTEHGCAPSAFTISATKTFEGESSAISSLLSSVPEVVISTQLVTVTPSATKSEDDNSSGVTDLPVGNGGNGGNGGGSSSRRKSNVGPIAGGVVGGLAVLAAIVFGIVYLIMRKKKKDKAAATAGTVSGPPASHNNPNYEYKPAPQDPNYPTSPYSQQAYSQGYPQQGYPQGFPQQGDPNMGYYGQGQEAKQGYPTSSPGHPTSPYHPPTSPGQGYVHPVPGQQGQQVIHQLDSTAIQGQPKNAEGKPVHEAP